MRFSNERPNVISSVYSISLPTLTPRASCVTATSYESDVCPICSSVSRDPSTVCVVETVKDVMSIENTGQFTGLYHVLGGVISPMDGIGPDQLEIGSLVERVAAGGVKEVILALSATMEGETTDYYIYRKLGLYDVAVTQLARGVSVGNEIEYTDDPAVSKAPSRRSQAELMQILVTYR
mgnify:CR=1 FL=1